MEIFQPKKYVNASYKWLVYENFMGKLPNYSFLRQTIKVEVLLHTVKSLQTKKHKSNHKKNKLMQTTWFQANFAVYLCFRMKKSEKIAQISVNIIICNHGTKYVINCPISNSHSIALSEVGRSEQYKPTENNYKLHDIPKSMCIKCLGVHVDSKVLWNWQKDKYLLKQTPRQA